MTERPLPHILNRIAATKRREIDALLAAAPLTEWRTRALDSARMPARPFLSAVAAPGQMPNIIAEVKKASPSKGIIRPDFDPPAIAAAYRYGGAAAISCLTDAEYFQGRLEYLLLVREVSGLPVLRKDFLIHPVQLYEARAAGADAVLLIARMLAPEELKELYVLAGELGMAVLLEVHDEPDVEKSLAVGPALLGVNNRDLDTFVVDTQTTFRLRALIPRDIPLVAESGLETAAQLRELAAAGVSAALVGESLMREPDIANALLRLRGKL